MNFEQFIDAVKNEVREIVGEHYTVSVNCVMKINRERQGLSISGKGTDTFPSVYLEEFYEDYKSGKPVHDIALEIIKIVKKRKQDFADFALELRDYKWVKPRLRVKLINYRKNEKLLKTVPHERFLDLAVIPYILISCDNGLATTRVVYSLLECWGITAEEILKQAKENTLREAPVVVERMSDFILNIMLKEIEETADGESEMLLKNLLGSGSSGIEMFILTNETNMNGAFAAFQSDNLWKLAESTGNEALYVLPSSTHEILAVPAMGMEPDKLQQMVREVNSTQESEEDYLSDSVYLYSKEKDQISIAAKVPDK